MNRLGLRDIAGCTLVRYATVDGGTYNVDDDEAARTIGHRQDIWRAMPGGATGDMVIRYLYAILRIDPYRYVMELPQSMLNAGASRVGAGGNWSGGKREGFVHLRDPRTGKADPGRRPIGTITFATPGERIRDDDPTSRADFERLG